VGHLAFQQSLGLVEELILLQDIPVQEEVPLHLGIPAVQEAWLRGKLLLGILTCLLAARSAWLLGLL